ncbi:MAG: hypothetical protein POELPBGB_02661 [Bacteroidia bacterium]|nr:hypothetical protein [Bacteroidia bacterium]
MKKVLILCYDFPPLPSIGAQRPFSFFRHLPKYKFHPVVITRKWKENITAHHQYFEGDEGKEDVTETELSTLIKLPEKQSFKNKLISKYGINNYILLRKAISFSEIFLKWIVPIADDKYYIYKRATEYLKEHKVDFILATGEPFILFKYAYSLSKKFNTPFILDYRDGWTTNHTVNPSTINLFRLKFESLFEKNYLNNALLYSSVSEGVINEIEQKYNVASSRKFLLRNGAATDDLKNISKRNTNTFNLVYAGTLYDTSPVNELLSGIEQFINKSKPKNFCIYFIGIRLKPCVHIGVIEKLKSEYPKNIEILDSLPPKQLAGYLQEASVLLLLLMKSQKKGIIGGKTYEYAATRNPILVVQEERTEETPFFQGRDIQTFAFTADEVAQKIEMYYNKYQRGESLQTSITDEEIFSISREYQVKLLAEKLNSL